MNPSEMELSGQTAIYERTKKMVLYVGIFSIVMLFAAFSSAYIISSYGELWVSLSLPMAFYFSTAAILLSSFTIHMAVKASNGGNEAGAMRYLLITITLGVAFGISQYIGWSQMVGQGSFLSGHVDSLNGEYGRDYSLTYRGQELVYDNGDYYFPGDNLREKPLKNEIAIFSNSTSSYIYALSFVHLLHVLGGMIFLFVIYLAAQIRKRGINSLRLRLGATYWHFVDGLWVYLLLFLLIFH